METKPSLPKLALGAFKMINWAISDHRRRFYGVKPCRIELHPAVMQDFKIGLYEAFPWDPSFAGPDVRYRDVDILSNRLAERPLMVNCNNDIEYL